MGLWYLGLEKADAPPQREASFTVIPVGRLKLPPAYDQPDKMTWSKRKTGRETALKQRQEPPGGQLGSV